MPFYLTPVYAQHLLPALLCGLPLRYLRGTPHSKLSLALHRARTALAARSRLCPSISHYTPPYVYAFVAVRCYFTGVYFAFCYIVGDVTVPKPRLRAGPAAAPPYTSGLHGYASPAHRACLLPRCSWISSTDQEGLLPLERRSADGGAALPRAYTHTYFTCVAFCPGWVVRTHLYPFTFYALRSRFARILRSAFAFCVAQHRTVTRWNTVALWLPFYWWISRTFSRLPSVLLVLPRCRHRWLPLTTKW